jgi:two-component system, LuxR family, response regulator FixJ
MALNQHHNDYRFVYLIEDDPAERHRLSNLLVEANYSVKAFVSGQALLTPADETTNGVLVLELFLTDMTGLSLQSRLVTSGINLKPIFISASGTIETSVQAMREGAIDFLEKPFTDERFMRSVKKAAAETITNDKVVWTCDATGNHYKQLTRREREIMDLLVEGSSSRKMAERLGLSSRTVEVHRAAIMRKLGARSLAQLVRIAYMNSNLRPEDMLLNIRQPPMPQKDQSS